MSINQWKSIFEEMGKIAGMKSYQLEDNGNCSIINAHPLCPVVHVYYNAPTDTVAVFAEVGFINSTHETNLMRIVLRQNYLNKFGLTYAIAPTGALIAQLFSPIADLTPQDLATALNRFTVELMKTRRMLFMTKKEPTKPEPLSPENALMI